MNLKRIAWDLVSRFFSLAYRWVFWSGNSYPLTLRTEFCEGPSMVSMWACVCFFSTKLGWYTSLEDIGEVEKVSWFQSLGPKWQANLTYQEGIPKMLGDSLFIRNFSPPRLSCAQWGKEQKMIFFPTKWRANEQKGGGWAPTRKCRNFTIPRYPDPSKVVTLRTNTLTCLVHISFTLRLEGPIADP